MGRYLTGRSGQSRIQSSGLWRCVARKGSIPAEHRSVQSVCKGELSVCSGGAAGHLVAKDESSRPLTFGVWRGAGASGLGREVELTKKKCSEAWRVQRGPQASRVGLSLNDPARRTSYKIDSTCSRSFHDGNVDVRAESFESQRSTLKPSISPDGRGIPEEYYLVVKNVNNVLGTEGWETGLQELNLRLSTQLVCDVIKSQANASAALAFFQWTKEQEGFEHSARTYKAMLSKLMSRQDFKSRSMDSFQIIMKESLHMGWSPGVTIHTYLIDGLCKLGKADEAMGHFDEMIAHGCAPNVVTYSSLIGGLVKVDRAEEALHLLDKMEEYKCYPNVVTFSVLIHGLVKHNRLDEACRIFDRMNTQGCVPNVITYGSLIDGAAKAGKFETVSKLVDHMRKTRCVPNVFIYGTVINFFSRIGRLQRAWDLFQEMKEHGIVPNQYVYTPLLSSFGKAGKWDEGQGLLAEMRSKGCEPDVVTYSAFVAGLVRIGNMDEAMVVLDQMEDDGCPPNDVIYAILINGLLKAKEKRRAKALYTKMVSKGITPRYGIKPDFFEEDPPESSEPPSPADRLDVPRPHEQ